MSQDDLVDVVNESGNFLKTVSKKVAHELGLLHKCVVAEVMDSKGQWLLIKQPGGKQDAGQYVSPMGGHVDAGESDVDCLKRETKEELGWDADFKYELVGKVIFNRYVLNRHENHLLLVYQIYTDTEPILNHESESYRYFSESELKQGLKEHPELFGDAFHLLVNTFFKQLL